MPVKIHPTGSLVSRSSQAVPMLDDPPIGHLQALVLKKLDDLGPEAFGQNAIRQLSEETGVQIDVSAVYSSIRRLLKREPEPYLELSHTRRSPEGGPPLKIYKVTAAGRHALKVTARHHHAVGAYLDKDLVSSQTSVAPQRELGAGSAVKVATEEAKQVFEEVYEVSQAGPEKSDNSADRGLMTLDASFAMSAAEAGLAKELAPLVERVLAGQGSHTDMALIGAVSIAWTQYQGARMKVALSPVDPGSSMDETGSTHEAGSLKELLPIVEKLMAGRGSHADMALLAAIKTAWSERTGGRLNETGSAPEDASVADALDYFFARCMKAEHGVEIDRAEATRIRVEVDESAKSADDWSVELDNGVTVETRQGRGDFCLTWHAIAQLLGVHEEEWLSDLGGFSDLDRRRVAHTLFLRLFNGARSLAKEYSRRANRGKHVTSDFEGEATSEFGPVRPFARPSPYLSSSGPQTNSVPTRSPVKPGSLVLPSPVGSTAPASSAGKPRRATSHARPRPPKRPLSNNKD